MTAVTLRQQIRKNYGFSIPLYYFFCVVIFIMGIIILVATISAESARIPPPWYLYPLPALLIVFSLNGFWVLARAFRVFDIESAKTLSEKKTVIAAYFENINAKRESDKTITRFINKSNIFSYLVTTIYFDDKKILFIIHSSERRGFIGLFDFGASGRAVKKLRQHLESYL